MTESVQASLRDQLAALKAEKDAARPAAATAIMNRATEELQASDILRGLPKVGDAASVFARPDLTGRTVRLESLLKKGPTIVSFFRGRW